MSNWNPDIAAAALLSPDEMAAADRLTIDGGLPGAILMERAGAAVADAVCERVQGCASIACLAGPGNNGGDAFVAARHLRERGFDVTLFLLGDERRLQGDAAVAAGACRAERRPLSGFDPASFDLVVDGLFGAGLARPIEGEAARAIGALAASSAIVVAIDLPSGISGESGTVLGTAVRADASVTFFRAKPGHVLEPGRSHVGTLIVKDIGIEANVLDTIRPATFVNGPDLWARQMAWPGEAGHKYDRGHAVVFSGSAARTGAARLAAGAALRAGAGLVTVFSPSSALLVNASHLTAIMLKRCNDTADLTEFLKDDRLNAFVLGPGFGVGEAARDYARLVLEAGRRLVLDADGITGFAEAPDMMFDLVRAARETAASGDDRRSLPRLVLTPHAGEFKRLFPDIAAEEESAKTDKARKAAARSGAVVVLKGRDTVIAAPDGRAAINATGTPWLATAGSGDVLTGIIAAQLAQGTPSFEAAAAGVWMHGKAAEAFGPGLIAEDLALMMPKVLTSLGDARSDRKNH